MNEQQIKNQSPPTLAAILQTVRANAHKDAEQMLAVFLAQKFTDLSLKTGSVKIRKDAISLNSVNGTFEDRQDEKYFFKFHLEEGESDTLEEYYKAEVLNNAGYPVEMPLFVSRDVGEQILVYPYVEYERLFDVCARNEAAQGAEAEKVIKAQQNLDKISAAKSLETLCTGTHEDYAAESLLQLFLWRLVDKAPDGTYTPHGGRHKSFYIGQNFVFPGGLNLSYEELADLKWNINGVSYDLTLGGAFEQAYDVLDPKNTAEYPACTGHGDAHNGNLWFKDIDGQTELSYFDPAFAGEKMPILLNEVKPLFHNIFAHPLWLYNAKEADINLDVSAEVKDGTLYVQHNWALSPLREKFLESKAENFWTPVLKALKAKNQLDDNWETFVRAALFCCPTLVMNLRSHAGTAQNAHTEQTSLLGLSIAMMLAAKPTNGTDSVNEFFKTIGENL